MGLFIECILFALEMVGGARGNKPLHTHHLHHDSQALPHFPIECIYVFNVDLTSTAWILASPCHCTSVTLFLAPCLSLAFLPKILVYPHLPFPLPPFILRTQCLFLSFHATSLKYPHPKEWLLLSSQQINEGTHGLKSVPSCRLHSSDMQNLRTYLKNWKSNFKECLET